MTVGEGYVEREICDGQSLASPGRWPIARRRYPETELWKVISSLCMDFAESHGTPQFLLELALGKVKACLFNAEDIGALKRATDKATVRGEIEVERTRKDRTDLPIDYRYLGALSKSAGDPEVSLGAFAVGVRLGPGVRTPRLPALHAKKRRWEAPGSGRPGRMAGGASSGARSLEAELLLVGGMVRRMVSGGVMQERWVEGTWLGRTGRSGCQGSGCA